MWRNSLYQGRHNWTNRVIGWNMAVSGRCSSQVEKHSDYDEDHRRGGVKIDDIRGVEHKQHTYRDQDGCAE